LAWYSGKRSWPGFKNPASSAAGFTGFCHLASLGLGLYPEKSPRVILRSKVLSGVKTTTEFGLSAHL
jgi:hypothetical protein